MKERMLWKGKQVQVEVGIRKNVCVWCGKTREENKGRRMSLHHIKYGKKKLDNVIELCSVCHTELHAALRGVYGDENGKKKWVPVRTAQTEINSLLVI